MNIRLGIIGTGRIAERFAQDGWQGLPVTLSSVYNPRLASAQTYAAQCNQIGRASCRERVLRLV